MTGEPADLLRSKAALLLRRERELADVRRAHERTAAWFRAFHTLSFEVQQGPGTPVAEAWTARLVHDLGFQAAAVFAHEPGRGLVLVHGLSPGPLARTLPAGADLLAPLRAQGAGRRNQAGAAPPVDALAAGLGLDKLLWQLTGAEDGWHLWVAGFHPEAARYQDDLTEEDQRSFTLVARHVHALLRTSNLIGELQHRNAQYQERSEELRLANQELAASIRERDLTQTRLMAADRMASVGTLAGGMAHEINNPLAFVTSNLEYLSEELADAERNAPVSWPEIHEAVGEARQGAERMRRIVRDLKAFSGAQEEAQEPVDVERALELAVRISAHEIRHRARLVTDFQAHAAVVASQHRLGQVFVNLLVNAAQAIGEGAPEQNEIRIATRCVGPRVVIEIRDTGCGIPEAVRARIFEPFFTTKPIGIGTGLGLSICHGIVKGFDGEIEVESEPGKGSTFRVLLPKAPRAEAAAATAPAAP